MRTSSDKPYRVYRQPRRVRGDGSIPWDTATRNGRDGTPGRPDGPRRARDRRGRRAFRYLRRVFYVLVLVAAVWAGIAYWSFRSAVEQRNELVPAKVHSALSATDGPALSTPRNILLLGSDSRGADAGDPGRSDTMMLVRVDVAERHFAMLSIPRDLGARVPGYEFQKINSYYQIGGPALTVKAVRELTGLPIHHYVLVDFEGFKFLIDEIGGIEVDNPREIRSNRFDGRVWKFPKGRIPLTGRRALAYARVRHNELDPNESDLTRARRQQAVFEAIAAKVVSVDSLRRPRDVPQAAVQPLTTEITASEMLAFGFGRYWAKDENKLRCRLGGDIEYRDGSSYIIGGDENRATVRMWLGDAAPLKPNVKVNPFAPGCTRGG